MKYEEYQSKLKDIRTQREKLETEFQVQLQLEYGEQLNSYVGKYFSYKNSYNPDDFWNEYLEVVEVLQDSMYVNSKGEVSFTLIVKRFCQRQDGEIVIHNNDRVGSWMLEKEITEGQFIMAQKEILNKL